jgi:hypothetical protein
MARTSEPISGFHHLRDLTATSLECTVYRERIREAEKEHEIAKREAEIKSHSM